MKQSLSLKFNKHGQIAEVNTGEGRLTLAGGGGFAVEEVLTPHGKRQHLGAFTCTSQSSGKTTRIQGAIESAALTLNATIKQGRYVEVQGEVADLAGVDRALYVRFTLPVKLNGWRWEGNAARSETIRAGQSALPSDINDFIFLGKKFDGFADEDYGHYAIRTNKLPFMAVCKKNLGLAMAYPVHEPRVFLMEADAKGITITFALGVTPITEKFPGRASFRFIIYGIDGAWGIRSAAEYYYAFFPELFSGRCARHGNIGILNDPDRTPPPEHLKDLGIVFIENDYQWSDGQIGEKALAIAKDIGVDPRDIFHWRGPWYWFHEAPGDITHDAQLARMKAQAEGCMPGAHGKNNQLCGCPNELSAKAAYNSYIQECNGKLARICFQYPSYSCWLLPMNMDPNLPKPNRGQLATEWQYRYMKRWKEKGFRGPFGIAYDAFDDFSGFRRLNFRRSHLAVMDVPATFDPDTGILCQVKGFHDCAWARVQTGLAHKAGGKVMANINLEHSMMFGGQYADVILRERRADDHDDERLSVHRMLMGQKPISFPGGSRAPDEASAWRREAMRLLTFGMSPGVRGSMWQELRVHMPWVEKVVGAGWQPVTYATAKGAWAERFGNRSGHLYFAVRNGGNEVLRTKLNVDLQGLGLGKQKNLALMQVYPEKAIQSQAGGNVISASLQIPAGETAVILVKGTKK